MSQQSGNKTNVLLSLGHDRQGSLKGAVPTYRDGVVNTLKAAVSSTDVKLPLTASGSNDHWNIFVRPFYPQVTLNQRK